MPATMCSHPSFIIQLLCFLLTSSNLNSQSTSNSSDVLYNWTTAMASMQEEGSSCPECFQNMVGELDERFLLMKEEAMRNVKYLNDLRVIQSNFSDLHVILQSVLSSIADIKYSNTSTILYGEPGATGATGAIGPIGATGFSGSPGPTGYQGYPGATGMQGPTGMQGSTGSSGVQGATGITGNAGPAGPAGPAGSRGAPGPAGAIGATGATGATGLPGPRSSTG